MSLTLLVARILHKLLNCCNKNVVKEEVCSTEGEIYTLNRSFNIRYFGDTYSARHIFLLIFHCNVRIKYW